MIVDRRIELLLDLDNRMRSETAFLRYMDLQGQRDQLAAKLREETRPFQQDFERAKQGWCFQPPAAGKV